jgi:hypothetical protein
MDHQVVPITDPASSTKLFRCTKCGSTCEPKDRGRFKRRHPSECIAHVAKIEAKRAFAKQLAQGTKSVDEADRIEAWLEDRDACNTFDNRR